MWLVSCSMQGMLTQGPSPDPKCKFDYFIIPYTSTFIRLSYLYEECHAHCIVITNDGGDGIGGGWLIYVRVWVVGQGMVLSYTCFVFLSCAFVFCCLTFSVPLCRWLELDGCCVCFFVFSLFSLSLAPLTRSH